MMMIGKLTTQKMLTAPINKFMFAKLVKQGTSIVAQLPTVDLPVRQKKEVQDRFNKKHIYDLNVYQNKNKPPRCRYYALQYKNRIYHVYNAYHYPIGRMVGQIATAIRGKNSPLYRNSIADVKNGDVCIIVNAADPLFTGKKLQHKKLRYHTGFIGHLRTFSYKHVLNTKPELLYYYLLRKFMPKNKLSAKYLENVKIYRGPTHDIPNLPQFAPDKNIYEYLPESNLDQLIKLTPGVKILHESQPGLAKKIHGRDFEYVQTQEEFDLEQAEKNKIYEDTSQLYEAPSNIIEVNAYSKEDYAKLRRKENRYLKRYKPVRAPYKKSTVEQSGFLYVEDERKAKKMVDYNVLADEDKEEEDDQIIEDPFGRKAKEEVIAKAKEAEKNSANKKDK